MGFSSARDMAAQMGLEGRELAVSWHLSHNHFPPVPSVMVSVALEAIEHAEVDDWDHEIVLPEGVSFRNRPTVQAGEVVEAFHLHAFLDLDDGLYADDEDEYYGSSREDRRES